MSTKSLLSVIAVLGLLAVAAVLGVVVGQRTVVGQPVYEIEATPATDQNLVDSDHMVTATVTSDAVPQEDVDVTFDITAGPNVGDSGTDVTNADGQAFFTYTGDGGIGTDTIHVCALAVIPSGAGGVEAAQMEPVDCVDVEKEWIEPTPTPSPTPAPTPTPTAAPTPTPTAPAAPDILPPSGGEPGGDGGFPWAVVGLALGGLVLLASGAALMRRAR